MNILKVLIFVLSIHTVSTGYTQTFHDITRIEFNAGTRSFREQVIITSDSIITIKEDFKSDDKPTIIGRTIRNGEWLKLTNTMQGIVLKEIPNLKSPTSKRTYDGAAHGSIIITAKDTTSWSHSFDDEDPHDNFRPLLKQIRKITNRSAPEMK